MEKDELIRWLCVEHTNLYYEEIEEVVSASKRLVNMSSLFGADAFIDCLMNDGSGDAIVIAEANPKEDTSSYTGSVVGMVATKEKEPAVHRSLSLGVTTRFMKAETQENVYVVQTVDPIFYKGKVVGVYIIEQKMEQIKLNNTNYRLDSSLESSIDMDVNNNEDKLKVADTIEEGLMFVDYKGKVIMCNKAMSDIYERLGFISEIIGAYYNDICLIRESESDMLEPIRRREIRIGNYYFRIKRVNVNRSDVRFIINLADITGKKIQEKALVLKSAAIKEMHHRIKNNLQTIASLLRLQRNKIKSREGKEALDDSINRILAISATHELMMGSYMGAVRLNDIINLIMENMRAYYSREDFSLGMECIGGDFDIDIIKAVAVALIINELIQNSLKHAFVNRDYGNIYIKAEKKGDQVELSFYDDGCGFNIDKKIHEGTMGLSIVKLMTEEKLKGHLYMKSEKVGTKFRILF